MSPAAAPLVASDLAIDFGGTRFRPRLPVLAGDPVENLFSAVAPAGSAGRFQLFRGDDWLLGAASVESSVTELEPTTLALYAELLAAAQGMHLARIWNYVPEINGEGPGGLENYRAFCRGRSLAFEREHGTGFNRYLPAASTVGCLDGLVTIAFVATAALPRHFENPLQVPAYHYPQQYGPRPPTFARATVVPGTRGRPAVFFSGTAAIRGHATVAPESTRAQLECTLENLRSLSRVCQLGDDLGAGGHTRHFKVYLRNPEDCAEAAATLGAALLRPGDRVAYVQADICRAALRVEIEATLL